MAGLVKLDAFARKIEQRRNQPPRVRLVTPKHHRECGVTAFGFIQLVILVAGAVVHPVAIDELEILDDQMAPCVIHVRLRHFHVHAAPQNFLPGLDALLALLVVTCPIRHKEDLTCRKRFRRNCQRRNLLGADFRVRPLSLPGPILVEIYQRLTMLIA